MFSYDEMGWLTGLKFGTWAGFYQGQCHKHRDWPPLPKHIPGTTRDSRLGGIRFPPEAVLAIIQAQSSMPPRLAVEYPHTVWSLSELFGVLPRTIRDLEKGWPKERSEELATPQRSRSNAGSPIWRWKPEVCGRVAGATERKPDPDVHERITAAFAAFAEFLSAEGYNPNPR